jgi:hypothetical protein
MPIHFLQSSRSRTLSIIDITALNDDQAWRLMCKLRWLPDGQPICPSCQNDRCYTLRKRDPARPGSHPRFKCARCGVQFSVTSGTLLHSNKLAFQQALGLCFVFVNGVKGKSALEAARDFRILLQTGIRANSCVTCRRDPGRAAGYPAR